MFILDYKIILRAMNIILYLYQGLQIKFPWTKMDSVSPQTPLFMFLHVGKEAEQVKADG